MWLVIKIAFFITYRVRSLFHHHHQHSHSLPTRASVNCDHVNQGWTGWAASSFLIPFYSFEVDWLFGLRIWWMVICISKSDEHHASIWPPGGASQYTSDQWNFWCTKIAHHKEQAANPTSHVVQGAATSLGQRFVRNKQTEGERTPEVRHFLSICVAPLAFVFFFPPDRERTESLFNILETQMPGPTQALSPNGENNNDIVQDNGTNIIPYRKNTVRGERAYR